MADVLTVRDKYGLQEWAQIHRRCQESGLSNREFCRQNGIADDMIHIRFGAAALELPAETDAASIASLLQALQKL